jgi:ribonuclease D
MEPRTEVLFIETASALEALCARLKDYAWLAVDTEFHREKTYYPQLCLLQIGTPDFVVGIDAYVLTDLTHLLEVIYNPRITKVMHASRQDLEIFHHLRGKPPGPVFDTQLAAPLLGYPDQIGYANLVQGILGVKLKKAYTRTDWTRRPLSAEQVCYALDDVRYLVEIYRYLDKELRRLDRLTWLEEGFAILIDPALYSNPPASAWQRVAGNERLRGMECLVLQALAAWREQMARQEDRPRHWLVRDDTLIALARLQPETEAELRRVSGLHPRIAGIYGTHILGLIARAKLQPPLQPPAIQRSKRLTLAQEALVDCLMAVVRVRSYEHTLDPSVLISRKELEKIVCGEKDLNTLCRWKHDIIGVDLKELLNGRLTLRVDKGRVLLKQDKNCTSGSKGSI